MFVSRYPSPKKRNLEKTDRDLQVGAWRISALADPITEKRFRLFSLASRALANFSPVVPSYRCEAAHLIGGARCAGVVSAALEGDRVEILTPWFDLVDIERVDDAELAEMTGSVLRTFALFEKHCFFATDLFPEAIGRDESGGWVLLPPAYAAPVRAEPHAQAAAGRSAAGTRAHAAWESFEYPEESVRRGHHVALCGRVHLEAHSPCPGAGCGGRRGFSRGFDRRRRSDRTRRDCIDARVVRKALPGATRRVSSFPARPLRMKN